MSEETLSTKQAQAGSGKALAIAFLSVLYSVVDELTADLTLLFTFGGKEISFGIFVPASASIIFGRSIGGISGGLGEILIQVNEILFSGADISTIHLGTLINSIAIGIGAWLTGFLGKENTKEESPDTYKQLLTSPQQWGKIGTDVIAAVVGLGITKNFLYAYGSQLQEGASIIGGTQLFLQQFVADSIALIVVLPITLVGYDIVQVFLKKRDEILEKILLDIDKSIEVEKGIKIIDLSLPKGIMVMGKWTSVRLMFQNELDKESAFHIDAVSTSRMYPDTDKTEILKSGGTWVQTFYILPAKQREINLRIRITPEAAQSYKSNVEEQAIVEVTAKTKNPSSMTASLLGFGGVNFGVVGISAAWNKIIQFLGNPQLLFDQLAEQWQLIWVTLVAEILLFVPILLYMYRKSRNTDVEKTLRLGFTRGFDRENIQARATGFMERLKDRYQGRTKQMIQVIIGLGSVIGVGYLILESIRLFTQDNYELQNPNLIFGLAITLFGVWIFGVRGGDLLKALRIGELAPWEFDSDNTILSFKPLTQLQVNVPSEILVKAQNISSTPGVRIVFQGFDSISPQVVELHIDPGEATEFKIAVTPLKKEIQDILAIVYPLFDEEQNYIDPNEAEPYEEQEIQYEVQGQTSLGITKSQQSQLKKGLGAGGFLAIAYTFIGQFIALPDFDQFLAENGILFGILQAPFLYAYFYFNNKFKSQLT